jgi:hypothetical protein
MIKYRDIYYRSGVEGTKTSRINTGSRCALDIVMRLHIVSGFETSRTLWIGSRNGVEGTEISRINIHMPMSMNGVEASRTS